MSDQLAVLSVDQLTNAVSRVVAAVPTSTPGPGPLSPNHVGSGTGSQASAHHGVGTAGGCVGSFMFSLDVGSRSAARVQTPQTLEPTQFQQFPGAVTLSIPQSLPQVLPSGGNQVPLQSGLRPLLPAPAMTLNSTPTVVTLPTNNLLTNPTSIANSGNTIVALQSNQLLTNVNHSGQTSNPGMVAMPTNALPANFLKALPMQTIQFPFVASGAAAAQPIAQTGQVPTQVLLPGGSTGLPSGTIHIQPSQIQSGQVQNDVNAPGSTLFPVLTGQKSGTPTYIWTTPAAVGAHNIIQAPVDASTPPTQSMISVTCSSSVVNMPSNAKPVSVNSTMSTASSCQQVLQLHSMGGKSSLAPQQIVPSLGTPSSGGLGSLHILQAPNDSLSAHSATSPTTFTTAASHTRENLLMSPSTLSRLVADHQGEAHTDEADAESDADALVNIQNMVSSVAHSNSAAPGKENRDLQNAQEVLDIMLKNDIHPPVSDPPGTVVQDSASNHNGHVHDATVLQPVYPTTGQYCVECNAMFESGCPVHKDFVYEHIPDSPVLSRARITLPLKMGFRVPVSQVGSANLMPEGIMTRVELPTGARFGPLVGQRRLPDENLDVERPRIWKIFGGDGDICVEILDCRDPEQSNWLMYMRMARTTLQQNVVAYQQDGEIYFTACKAVTANSELFYWFSYDYARMIGLNSSPEEYLRCGVCKKQFTDQPAMERHIRYQHLDTSSRRYLCKVCSRGFTSSTKLNTHMHTHLGLRPHKCSFCQKTFADQSNLRTHLKIHTGEKRFVCGLCEKAFRQKAHLASHLLIHTGEKNHQCQHCCKYFARASDLRQHEFQHTQKNKYVCHHESCNKTFFKQQNLKKHLKVHDGVRDFGCTDCGKKFFSKFHLHRHQSSCKGAEINPTLSSEEKAKQQKLSAAKKQLQRKTRQKKAEAEAQKQQLVIQIVEGKHSPD